MKKDWRASINLKIGDFGALFSFFSHFFFFRFFFFFFLFYFFFFFLLLFLLVDSITSLPFRLTLARSDYRKPKINKITKLILFLTPNCNSSSCSTCGATGRKQTVTYNFVRVTVPR